MSLRKMNLKVAASLVLTMLMAFAGCEKHHRGDYHGDWDRHPPRYDRHDSDRHGERHDRDRHEDHEEHSDHDRGDRDKR